MVIVLDKDDCLVDENLCGPYGTCLNIQGSFECECTMGFLTTDDKKACKGKKMHVICVYSSSTFYIQLSGLTLNN